MQNSQRNSQTSQTHPSTSPYYTQMNYASPRINPNQPTNNSLTHGYSQQGGSSFHSQSRQQYNLYPNQSPQHHNLAPNHFHCRNLLNPLPQLYDPTTVTSPSHIPSNPSSNIPSHIPSNPPSKIPSNPPSNIPSKGLSVKTNPMSEATSKSTNAPRFEKQDYLNIIEYLSTPRTYNLLFGAGKKTSVTGKTMQTAPAWNVFATHINFLYNERKKPSNFNRMDLSGSDLRQRFGRYRLLYCRTKGRSGIGGTGSGLTSADEACGINTIYQKLEDLCPCYHAMDELFGEKANITAMDEWDSAIEEFNYNLDSDFDDDKTITCEDADDSQETITGTTATNSVRSVSLNRTHTFSNLLDKGHHQFPSENESQSFVQIPRLETDLDGVFQPLRSTVDNFEILLEGPSTWDTVSVHSSPVSNNATLTTNQMDCLPSPNTVSTSNELARISSQGSNLTSNTSSDQQQTQNIPKVPDQSAKRRTATKRQPKSKDKGQGQDSPNPLPPITTPNTATVLPSKLESKNPLAQAFITITEAKSAQFEIANKREQDLETRRMDIDAKRLKIEDDRMERVLQLDRRKLEREEEKEKQEELRMNLELAWQKEKFQLESLERNQDKRLAQMNMWLKEGKSVADVKLLLEMSGLAQPGQPI